MQKIQRNFRKPLKIWDHVRKMGHMAAQNVAWEGASQNSCETQLLSKLAGGGNEH